MATGDQQDFANRLRQLLPPSWFGTGLTSIDGISTGSGTPVLDTVLAAVAYPLSWDYVLFSYVLTQSRIATATGIWLDRISYDFLGTRLPRFINETDSAYRTRILAEIFRPRQTRAAITKALTDLTGRAPKLVEGFYPGDVGAYGSTGQMGYGVHGIYGSLQYRNQIFVTAFRPGGTGIPNVPGYGNAGWGYGRAQGSGQYCSMTQVTGLVTDAQIYATVAGIVAAGCTAWVAISN